MVSLMVDFETLGVSRDSVVLSVGLVVFNPETGELMEEHYHEFNINHQLLKGRTVDNKTVAWWNRTNQKEFSRLLHAGSIHTDAIKTVVDGLVSLYNIDIVWSRHQMDFDILNSFLPEGSQFPYYKMKDVSTFDVFGLRMKTNNHNALQDCKNQIEYVVEVLSRWRSVSNAQTVEPQSMPSEQSVPAAIRHSSS